VSQTNAYALGYRAFANGTVVNPYTPDTHFHREWDRGFNAAYFDNLAKAKKVPEAA
jgi:hypothetical protein